MADLNALALPDLFERLAGEQHLQRLLDAAFEEDLGLAGDITSRSIIPADRAGEGAIVSRAAGVVSGLAVLPRICERFEQPEGVMLLTADGESCAGGDELARLAMPLRDLLAIERTALNIIGRLSGIASLTNRYVNAVAGTGAAICDTRKTAPGLRRLEKYAVRCGGGTLHRIGLFDAALFKDNHIAHIRPASLPDELAAAARTAKQRHKAAFVEVEVDTIEQLAQVLSIEAGLIDVVLLDNMATEMLREAVARRDESAPGVLLEASGGITLSNVRAIAEAGVDRIAVGAITHSAAALDVGLDVTGCRAPDKPLLP